MLPDYFVIIGSVISFLGILSYLVDTLKGKAQPNKVSWFLWGLAPMIAFAAQLKQGVGIQSLMTFMVGFNPMIIFIASFFNKKAEWKIQRFDLICGAFSLVGLLLWYITQIGNIAILFSLLADGLASLPTVVKSYYEPETESPTAFLLAGISALLTILTIDNWVFQEMAFPIYIFFVCTTLYLLIQFKLGIKIRRYFTRT